MHIPQNCSHKTTLGGESPPFFCLFLKMELKMCIDDVSDEEIEAAAEFLDQQMRFCDENGPEAFPWDDLQPPEV